MKINAPLLAVLILCQACGKRHNSPWVPIIPPDFGKPYALPNAPEANPTYDSSNYGIYKGVAINPLDSSAAFKFNIANNGKSVFCLEYMNMVLRDSLIRYKVDPNTHSPLHPLIKDSSVIPLDSTLYAAFDAARQYRGYNASALFAISGNGTPLSMSVTLDDNTSPTVVLKERSFSQVYCFEGTYKGSYLYAGTRDSGQVAFVLTKDTILGVQLSLTHVLAYPASGATLSNNQFTMRIIDGPSGADFILAGLVAGNTCSGTWTRAGSSASGTFTAHRTL